MHRAILCLVLLTGLAACRDATESIRTEFVGSYAFSTTERRTIERIAGETTLEARKHLRSLAPQLRLQVRSGKEVSPELGATAVAASPQFVRWTVDPERPAGVVKIAESVLRQMLFHEFHHLVRFTESPGYELIDHVVSEGLATAFERDVTGAPVPWGEYPDDVATWVDELLLLPPDASHGEWLRARRPDGRRWIGMKAGTYLADRAMKKLNRTAADLVATPTDEILAAASFTRP
jgi:hypothetical protein